MRRRPARLGLTLWLTAMWMLLFVPAASAYVDSGSVAIMFQAIVAGLAAAGMFLRVFWRRIKNVFSRSSTDDEEGVESVESVEAVAVEDAVVDDHAGDASR
jgi:hypothetical protein